MPINTGKGRDVLRQLTKEVLLAKLALRDRKRARLKGGLLKVIEEYADSPHEEHDCKLVNALSIVASMIGTGDIEEIVVGSLIRIDEAIMTAPSGQNEFSVTVERKPVDNETKGEQNG